MNPAAVLVVESDATLREVLRDTLKLAGYCVETAADGNQALSLLENRKVGMVVSDVQSRPMDGDELLARIKTGFPRIPVLLMSACGDIEKAVASMRSGAVDYLTKPFAPELLIKKVQQSIVQPTEAEQQVVAEDLRTRELLELARRVARSEATVMIGGDSGTGKEVFARFIHRQSERSEAPFIAINCAAIPENMLEAVLFGYEKGAYTGAHQSAPGKFEQAQGGTLLLDEISEMSLALQAKLLRVLQEREVERLGGRKVIPLDVRVLATTNRKLREEVAAGRFREDLYYRLNVFPLFLPRLSERVRDILPLARFLLHRHCMVQGIPEPKICPQSEQRLLGHAWPGNARELDNVMHRALILCNGAQITPDELCFEMDQDLPGSAASSEFRPTGALSDDLRSVEEQMILDALREDRGSRKNAAQRLGISQRTLRYKIAKLRDAGVAIPG
jgi:two-component system response regulator FlrC